MTGENKEEIIDYYEQEHWLAGLQTRTALRMRRRMVDRWFSIESPQAGDSIFDVGATPDCERVDSNCMIPMFQERTRNITLYSPEKIEHLKSVFTEIQVRSPGQNPYHWPAADGEFDFVTSSAVIEHVGSTENQLNFLREAGRVASKGLFITTPNRWHFLEFHTKLLLLHWLPKVLHRRILRLLGRGFWAHEAHLNLLGPGEFRRLAEVALGQEYDLQIRWVWFMGVPSNLMLFAKKISNP